MCARLGSFSSVTLLGLMVALLLSCTQPAPPPPAPEPLIVAPVEPPPPQPASVPSAAVVRTMIIADLLYEARKALEDNRLTQGQDNAFDLFNEVLSFAPDNEVAQQGINDIALRYVSLANNATAIGQYAEAEALLGRAAAINDQSSALQAARARLQEARNTRRETFALDPDELSEQSLTLMARLGEIGQYIQAEEATFLITARSDEEGRWIYQVMRNAVGGQRLRGNIALGSPPQIQLTLPKGPANGQASDNGTIE